MENRKQRLIDLLKEKSLFLAKKGESFTLSSGKTSNYYLDVRKTALSPEGLSVVSKLIYQTIIIQKLNPDAACGVAYGGISLATATAIESFLHPNHIPALYIRKEPKEYGTRNLIEGEFEKGMKIVLVEDTVTSGASLLRAYNAVTISGGIVVGVIAVVDREEGAKEAFDKLKVPFFSLCKISEII